MQIREGRRPTLLVPVMVTVEANPGWSAVDGGTDGPLLVHVDGYVARWVPEAVAVNLMNVVRQANLAGHSGIVPYRVTRLRSMSGDWGYGG